VSWFRRGGILGRGMGEQTDLPFLGTFHDGGVAHAEGLAHVAAGEPIGAGALSITVVLQGDGAALMDDLVDEVYAVLDGERVEIVSEVNRELGRGRSRSGQRAGFGGRRE